MNDEVRKLSHAQAEGANNDALYAYKARTEEVLDGVPWKSNFFSASAIAKKNGAVI